MKKLNRILSLSAAAALALSLTACSGGPSGTADTPAGGSSNTPAAGETYKVAVIKQMDHASLDEIANAITARLDAIDRAGAARQQAAHDGMVAQLSLLEKRLKGLEDSNAARLDGMRGALVQGLTTIRNDNNRKLEEIRGTVATFSAYWPGARISCRMPPSCTSPRMPRVLTPDSTRLSPPTSAARVCISPRPL